MKAATKKKKKEKVFRFTRDFISWHSPHSLFYVPFLKVYFYNPKCHIPLLSFFYYFGFFSIQFRIPNKGVPFSRKNFFAPLNCSKRHHFPMSLRDLVTFPCVLSDWCPAGANGRPDRSLRAALPVRHPDLEPSPEGLSPPSPQRKDQSK